MGLDEETDAWRLRNQIKEKDAKITELENKLKEIQTKLSQNTQKLMKEKTELSYELERIKPSLEKKDDFLKEYSKESFEKVKELTEKISKIQKEWEMKYYLLENRCKTLETKYLEESDKNSKEIKKLNKLKDDLQQKLNEELTKSKEFPKLKEKIRELERESSLQYKEPKVANKIKELEEALGNKEKEIFDLKEKLQISSLKIKEFSDIYRIIPDLSTKNLVQEIENLNTQIKTLTLELSSYQGVRMETVIFGEKQIIECMKELVQNTKRSLLVFIPKFTQLEQLKLTSLPPRIYIQAATAVNPSDQNQMLNLDSYMTSHPNIKIRNYLPSDMYSLLSDSSTVFLGFIDEKNIPVGFKSTKETLISYLGGLLKDSYFRFTEDINV